MFSFDNREMDEYFETLPALVQHAIIMCDIKPRNLQELRELAENLA